MQNCAHSWLVMLLEFMDGPLRVLPSLLMLSAKQPMALGCATTVLVEVEEEIVFRVVLLVMVGVVKVVDVMVLGGEELMLVEDTIIVEVTVTVAVQMQPDSDAEPSTPESKFAVADDRLVVDKRSRTLKKGMLNNIVGPILQNLRV